MRVLTGVVAFVVVFQNPSFAKAPFSCDVFDSCSLGVSATGVSDNRVGRVPPASVSPPNAPRVEPALPGKSEAAVPEGLQRSDWNSIRHVYEKNRHAAVAVDAGFRARNPGQQWLTHFDGRGFVVKPDGAGWQWGLELQSYGFPGHQRSINGQAKTTADNDRVSYDWHNGLHEWFVNDRSGLEHGFTLNSRPPGVGNPQLNVGDRLEIRLAVRGGLIARAQADGLGVSFVNQQGSVVVNYAGLKVWDADKRELTARIEADATGLRLTVDERNARYPLTIDPIAQQAYLKASNTDASDQFGFSVAVSGDTVVVGAPEEDSNATGVNGNQADNSASGSGAAYVFVRDAGGVWTQQAYLKASNTDADDTFGFSVAVSGDTVVVVAVLEESNATGVNGNQADNSAIASGAAYVFVRDSGGIWIQQAYLKASNTDAGDLFGSSVAVSDDTVVVGASVEKGNAAGVNGNQADNSARDSGAAYVFVRDSGGIWIQQAYLKASNTDGGPFDGDQFGKSVAVSGDTVVVGADGEDSITTGVNGNQADNSARDSGAAYVFVRDSVGVWSQQAYLKASNTDANDRFGISVTVSGDTVVVGAESEDSIATGINGNQADNSSSFSGAAYVFVRDGGSVWNQQAYLKASNTDSGDWFGTSVAVSGDTVVVGAKFEDSIATGINGNQADNSAGGSGAAYVFVRGGGGNWSQQACLKASNTNNIDAFGISVAVSGDTVVVGAVNESSNATGVNGNQADNSASLAGAAYVFTLSVCGDGVVEGAEQCDDGGESSTCNIDCTNVACGDDILNVTAGEACDDGNTDLCDGCNAVCAIENCDDSIVCTSDSCDLALGCQHDTSTCVIQPPGSLVGEPGFSKDRYVSIDPTANSTIHVSTRVTRIGGTDKYVDCTSLTDLGSDGWYASLIDGPLPAPGDSTYYCDLGGLTNGLHMKGCNVVPGNLYDVAMTTDGTTFSSVLSIPTTLPQFGAGRYQGDTVGSFVGGIWSAPDGLNSASDIVAVVAKFTLDPTAPILARMDTEGTIPNGLITGGDISRAVAGFTGVPFGSGVTDCLTGTCVPPVGSCE